MTYGELKIANRRLQAQIDALVNQDAERIIAHHEECEHLRARLAISEKHQDLGDSTIETLIQWTAIRCVEAMARRAGA